MHIDLNAYGIVIDLEGDTFPTTGTITTVLHRETEEDTWQAKTAMLLYNTAVDVLEGIILAHACNGIDVQDENYLNGIREVFENIERTYLGEETQ